MEGKRLAMSTLRAEAALLPRPLVFTNGVFDILHRGHVTYLEEARALGAALIVAVNADASVRRLGKGDDRPLNAEEDRAFVLSALRCVDAVVIFAEDTPLAAIAEVRPDIYVKGGDYTLDQLPEAALVREWGGEARILPFVPGFSTTSLVSRIRT